jgi:ABC-2 type transport system ATP-binding protein
MNDAPAIEVKGLTKYYGDLLAVDHVSFEVRKGEIFGFLGPNGAGKTTTVRMLTTLLAPSEGTACIEGHDILKDPYGARERAGMLPEEANVYVELSAWDNLMFTGELYGVSPGRREERAGDLLRMLGLYERKNSKAREFSKGMRRRLAVAMALVHSPHVLFLDEPSSGLDVQSTILIRGLLEQLRDEGKTIFLTTHQMEEANQLCDSVAIINRGTIAAIDAPENLKSAIQSAQSVVVSFAEARDDLGRRLPTLEGVLQVRRDGDKFKLYTENPGTLVPVIVDLARDANASIVSLNCLGPTLEEVFIKITGLDVGGHRQETADGSA